MYLAVFRGLYVSTAQRINFSGLVWAPLLLPPSPLFSFNVTWRLIFILFFLILLFDPPTVMSLNSVLQIYLLPNSLPLYPSPLSSLRLYSRSPTERPLPLSSLPRFCILTLHCIYWSSSVSPLSPSHQLCVEAPFSPMRESNMNRGAYWEQWESQSLPFDSLNTSCSPLLSSLLVSI